LGRLSEFMALYKSKSTKKVYRWTIREFCRSVYGEKVDTEKGISLEDAVEKYFTEKRDHEKDVKKFFSRIADSPQKSVRAMMSIVKMLLLENKVELGEYFWKRLSRRIKGIRAVSQEKVPSNAELRRILTHMAVEGKAVYLMLVSSGMRIGEAMQLKLEDIDLDADPVKVNIRREYTKSGDARITFVSAEGKEAIQEWLKVRDDYIKTAVARSHFYEKDTESDRLFPFDVKKAYDQWTNALDKSKLNGRDPETNRHKIHPHVLRKFFRSKAGMVSVDMAEALMGHSGYLTDVYRKYANAEETLSDFYRQVEPSLEVFGRTGEQYAQLKEETIGLQAVVNRLTLENMSFKDSLEKAEGKRRKIEKELEKLKQGDVDIDRILQVLEPYVTAPLGMPEPDKDEEWLEKAYDRSWKVFEELKKRRLKQ